MNWLFKFLLNPKTVFIFFILAYIIAVFPMIFGFILPMKILVFAVQLLIAPLIVYCLFLIIMKAI